MIDTENCYRCLPKLKSAIGYIPIPEMANETNTQAYEERRILLCRAHYFEAKANCFYVVPFNRDDDPVDNFVTLVKLKHKTVRGTNQLKFGRQGQTEVSDVIESNTRRPYDGGSNGSRKRSSRIHYRSTFEETSCGLSTTSVESTMSIESLTCKNCISLLSREDIEGQSLSV